MINMIRADIYKMFKASAFKILLAITAAAAVALVIISNFIAEGKLNSEISGAVFLISDVSLLSILGGVAAGVFICNDFENKTIHEAIASGFGRSKVVISKALAFFTGIAVLLLPYALVTGIAVSSRKDYSLGNASLGFLHLLIEESGTALSIGEFPKLLVVMLVLTLILTAQLSICVFLALVLKKTVAVIAIYYGISITSGQLLGLAEKSELFDKLYSLTPFGGTYMFMTLEAGTGEIIKAVLVSIGFTAVILGLTCMVFRKKEIK